MSTPSPARPADTVCSVNADDREKELVQSVRAEALALFTVNQAGRQAAERVLVIIVAVSAILVGAMIRGEHDDIAMVMPPLLFLLLSYMFQQYIDVTVTGAAREHLEQKLAGLLRDRGLIYEYAVAPIRKTAPLKWSFRLLQVLIGIVVGGIVITCTSIAFDGQPWYVTVGYGIATLTAALSAGWSGWQMLRAPTLARTALDDSLRGPSRTSRCSGPSTV
jgi:hypothetical protein